jgi:hypothetical protein
MHGKACADGAGALAHAEEAHTAATGGSTAPAIVGKGKHQRLCGLA